MTRHGFPRLPEWRAHLTAYLGDVARMSFRPGRHDCALFAAGAVEAMTGVHPAPSFVDAYRSLDDGFQLLAQEGFADHVAMAAALFEEIPPRDAGAGDLLTVAEPGGMALGVCQGAAVYVLRPSGLGLVDLMGAARGFRV